MKEQANVIDRSGWGAGPWEGEPDRVEWRHAGLPCLIVRNELGGHWCGYAAVPPGHPLHGRGYSDIDVDVHGGLTYANPCGGPICHVPHPGEPDDVWWFGFDCAHAYDYMPAMDARLRSLCVPGYDDAPPYDHATAVQSDTFFVPQYRDLAYVQAETNRLAEQLAG